jgi:hypothetical protein
MISAWNREVRFDGLLEMACTQTNDLTRLPVLEPLSGSAPELTATTPQEISCFVGP